MEPTLRLRQQKYTADKEQAQTMASEWPSGNDFNLEGTLALLLKDLYQLSRRSFSNACRVQNDKEIQHPICFGEVSVATLYHSHFLKLPCKVCRVDLLAMVLKDRILPS